MNEKVKSKVKSVQGNGTYESKHGLMYKFDYVFDNDVALQAGHKSENHFNVGDEVEYEIKRTHETYGHSGTVSKPMEGGGGYGGGGKKQSAPNASFALSYAKDFCIEKNSSGAPQTPGDVTSVADVFLKWLNEN